MKTVRIGCGAGFAGDRIEPAVELATRGSLDYLVFECLAERTIALAQEARAKDPSRGFDHGVFVPLYLMYPQAEVPVLMLSMKSGYDPAAHIRLGQALAPLRDEGVLILGSGLTYHNMRGFGRSESSAPAAAFEEWLNTAIGAPDAALRNAMLEGWESATGARLAHPREDHLVPLFVIAGAAGEDAGRRVFADYAMNVTMASYVFGA